MTAPARLLPVAAVVLGLLAGPAAAAGSSDVETADRRAGTAQERAVRAERSADDLQARVERVARELEEGTRRFERRSARLADVQHRLVAAERSAEEAAAGHRPDGRGGA